MAEGVSNVEISSTNHPDTEGEDDLPEPPEEPLQSDCCGTGCSPCVLDIYQKELEEWLKLKEMTPRERAEWRKAKWEGQDNAVVTALSPYEYRRFTVERVRQLTKDTFVFTFGLPIGQTLGLQPGQHAMLRVCGDSGRPLTRQYTPISPLDQRGSFDMLIKIYENGRMSQYVKEWKVGSVAEWRGPFGGFMYIPNKYKRIGMLACGTGITPMIQIIRAIVENEEEDTFVHLVYGCRSQNDILLKDQLDNFASYWNFTVLYALSDSIQQSLVEDPGSIKYGDRVHFGRIDFGLVLKEMPQPSGKNLVLICGTKSFDKDMINHLSKMAYADEMYFKF